LAGIISFARRYDAWMAGKVVVFLDHQNVYMIEDTVNSALRQVGDEHRQAVKRRLDLLAGVDLSARKQAWH
jgi:hypothetical protein